MRVSGSHREKFSDIHIRSTVRPLTPSVNPFSMMLEIIPKSQTTQHGIFFSFTLFKSFTIHEVSPEVSRRYCILISHHNHSPHSICNNVDHWKR